ncbi:MAG: DoxX family protein [Chloroflexi bacterium]|nr:DoxX family protein [Chloroflexota bacterium]
MRTLPTAWGITVVRVMAGIIIFWSGVEKFLAGGFANWTVAMANRGFPVPEFWGVFIPLLETVGGLLLLFGLGARWVAIFYVVEYFGTGLVLKTHPFGGFDNMRIDLMLMATALAIVLVGPGAFALESLVLRRGQTPVAEPVPSS